MNPFLAIVALLLTHTALLAQALERVPVGNNCSVLLPPAYAARLASVTWNGGCKDGLVDGLGYYVATEKDGKRETYAGEMAGGRRNGGGRGTDASHIARDGRWVDGRLVEGTLLQNERPFYTGTLWPNGTFRKGKYMVGEAWIEGEFTDSGLPNPWEGKNIVSGTYFEKDGVPWYKFENGVKRDLRAEQRAAERAAYEQAEAERKRRDDQVQEIVRLAQAVVTQYAQNRASQSGGSAASTGAEATRPSGQQQAQPVATGTGSSGIARSDTERANPVAAQQASGGPGSVRDPATGQSCMTYKPVLSGFKEHYLRATNSCSIPIEVAGSAGSWTVPAKGSFGFYLGAPGPNVPAWRVDRETPKAPRR
jgi:hypothetical protein